MDRSQPHPQHLLHIDASARAGESGDGVRGSHTRRLSRRFVERWRSLRTADAVTYRDIGRDAPSPVTGAWIDAAFTPPRRRDEAARACLAESDGLVAELMRADVLVVGAPMYNFGIPAPLKAWIDNIVRVGVTFGFDRSRAGEPYWPMVPPGKRLVILSSRGDYGYDVGERLAASNLVERSITVPLAYIGITEVYVAAVEYDEFGDERLHRSIAAAEQAVDHLVDRLTGTSLSARSAPMTEPANT